MGRFFPTQTFGPPLQGRFCVERACVIFLKTPEKHSKKSVIKTSQINELLTNI